MPLPTQTNFFQNPQQLLAQYLAQGQQTPLAQPQLPQIAPEQQVVPPVFDPGDEGAADRQSALGQMLMKNAGTGPVRTPWEGVGRLANTLTGAYLEGKAGRAKDEYSRKREEALAKAFANVKPEDAANVALGFPELQGAAVSSKLRQGELGAQQAIADKRLKEQQGFTSGQNALNRQSRADLAAAAQAAIESRSVEQQAIADKRLKEQQGFTSGQNALNRQSRADATRAAPSAWQVLNDKNGTSYRYNTATGEATTLDMQPYKPTSAAKIQSGTSRSALAMATNKFMQENPDATSDDLAKFTGHYNKTLAQIGGETKADVGALTNVTKIGSIMTGNEQALQKSIALAQGLMSKGAGTSAGPVINRWLQAGRKATGDKDVAAFNSAMDTATNLYGMIITGSTGTTDASRREGKDIADKFQNPDAINEQFGVMLKDGHFKVQSYQDIADTIRGKLQAGSAVVPAQQNGAKPMLKFNPATGRVE